MDTFTTSNSPLPKRRANAKGKIVKMAKVGLLVLVAGAGLYGIGKVLTKPPKETQAETSQTTQTNIAGAKATTEINQEFSFPLKDTQGAEVSQVKMAVTSVEKRDEILVKGQKATAVKGRTFLIVNLKVTNDFDQGVQIDTRDYFRLSVNGNQNEWLAPDIHNDPVEVQAISTKFTRVGFPINDSDTQLLLRVGEISGDKQDLPLNI